VTGIRQVLCFGLTLAQIVLLLHVIFSWVPRPPDPLMPFVLGIRRLVEPAAAPVRKVLPPLRLGGVGLDLSILVLFFGIILIRSVLC